MKELNKENKITDKAFLRLAIMSVLAILICIIALSSSTWALFSDVKPSANNAIKAADNCSLEVSVSDSNTINVVMGVRDPKTLSLSSGVYKVCLSLPAESSSGYLNISYGDGVENNTDYLLRHKDDVPHTLEFTIVVDAPDVSAPIDVTFTPKWGTHSIPDAIHNEGTVEIK